MQAARESRALGRYGGALQYVIVLIPEGRAVLSQKRCIIYGTTVDGVCVREV